MAQFSTPRGPFAELARSRCDHTCRHHLALPQSMIFGGGRDARNVRWHSQMHVSRLLPRTLLPGCGRGHRSGQDPAPLSTGELPCRTPRVDPADRGHRPDAFGERHLRWVLATYAKHCNRQGHHRALQLRPPRPGSLPPSHPRRDPASTDSRQPVVARPHVLVQGHRTAGLASRGRGDRSSQPELARPGCHQPITPTCSTSCAGRPPWPQSAACRGRRRGRPGGAARRGGVVGLRHWDGAPTGKPWNMKAPGPTVACRN
jgi:hypothetical protein